MNLPLTSSHKTLLIIIGTSLVSVLSAYYFSGKASLIAALVIIVLLLLLRPLLMPPGYGATKVRVMSLIGVFGLASSYGAWSHILNAIVKSSLQNQKTQSLLPWLTNLELDNEPSIAALIFVFLSVWVINHYIGDNTIAGGHPVSLDTDFPEHSFVKKLDSFCSALRQHLVTTDRESNWSPNYYADLEAEVEILATAGNSEKKKILNLQTAIRSDRTSQAFLILGDPGAGKSVALRKLARDMLDEVGDTGRVPIYVNLREWLPSNGNRDIAWTEKNRPTITELESFVISNIKERGDVFTEEFVDKYFRQLWLHGRLFFIFDSFDEIPELLDVSEESWLINELSALISRFIISNPQSRGLLASRIFRRPTQAFLANKVLEIRPMTEVQIVQALKRYPAFTEKLRSMLFNERVDLIPVARNPFLMALLGEWVNDCNALPQNQAQLYDNYLRGRLTKCSNKLRELSLNTDQVLNGAMEIAWFVFKSPEYGLEAPVDIIDASNSGLNLTSIMETLSFARVARVTQVNRKSFAFVHRRFLEYFVTTRLLQNPADIPVEHIPTDSRGRDALVLYSQVCDEESATKLALLCWSEVKTNFNNPENRLRAIHCLRFLIDAFRARKSAINPFRQEFLEFIKNHVSQNENLIFAKICLEGTGLLSDTDALPIITIAMGGNNAWLQETAFRACRHLPKLEKDLEDSVINYVSLIHLSEFWLNYKSLSFSLTLSEALKGVKNAAMFRYWNLVLTVISLVPALLIEPHTDIFALFIGLQFLFTLYCSKGINELSNLLKKSGITPQNELAKENKNHQASKLSFAYIRSSLGNDFWIQIFRISLGLSLIVVGIGSSLTYEQNACSSSYFNVAVFWSALSPYTIQVGVLYTLLGIFIVDWLFLKTVFKAIILRFKLKPYKISLAITVTSITSFILLKNEYGLIQWLKRNNIEWIPIVIFVAIFSSILIPSIWTSIKNIGNYFKDRKIFRNLVINQQMQRIVIASSFNSLSTEYWRGKYVQHLSSQKVVATGSWPSDFKLLVSANVSLTELAKLEEKWLNLDR